MSFCFLFGEMKALFYVLVILRVMHLQMVYLDKEERYRIITLKQGDIRGKVVKMKKNFHLNEVEVYLGIPYAAPPITSLRFMPPGAPPGWSEQLDAFYMKPACPQMFPNLDNTHKLSPARNIFIRRLKHFLKNESEDCLYLNIYVPHHEQNDDENEKKRNYPVILFIHGESFEWNSGNLYDGSIIASYGEVIFVTINFRLGIFGFLKQELMAGRANYGLSDQIAALQWIKGNIAEFGGDTSRITVMGHDTGAACVNFLMLSPVAEGLFHRAILMAGSALSPWALTETPLHYIQLASELNCSLENNTNCFQRRRKEDIISAFKKFDTNMYSNPFESTFTPVVDEVVVLNSPAEHMEKYSTLFSKYDLLAGFNEIESYYLIREEENLRFGMVNSEARNYLETYIRTIFEKTPEYALEKTLEKYIGHIKGNSPIPVRDAVLDALSDMLVMAPVMQTLHYHAKTPKNTYFYVFGHHTASESQIKINKSIYGDDLPYALGIPMDGPSNHYTSTYTIEEEQLSETMLRYFTNFAKSGDPNNPNNYKPLLTYKPYSDIRQNVIRWPNFRVPRQPFMRLGMPSQVHYQYRNEYDKFWNMKLPDLVRKYGVTTSDVMKKPSDTIENDDSNSPPIYDLNTPESANYNPFNNFFTSKNPNVPHKNTAALGEDIATADTSSSKSTVTIVIILLGLIFLLINAVAFTFILYQRGKLRVRENLFRNRFRCKTVSVPDIFEANEASTDIYAIATNGTGKENNDRERRNLKNSFSRAVSRLTGKEKRKDEPLDYDYDTIRVASIKPEAINGKRMKRWPLSRQCSGSTITVDAHSKVRNWIAQEISHKRRNNKNNNKNHKTTEAAKDTAAAVEEKKNTCGKNRGRKVSIAIDATPAARTGSVLKQIPIEMTKSLDSGKSPLVSQMRTSSSMRCIRSKALQNSHAFASEDSEEYYQRTGTHKSSARIRLRTPEFLLEGERLAPFISHVHTRSDPSPMDQMNSQEPPIYSKINKEAKRLKSFVDSTGKTDSFVSNSTNVTSHYEDMGGVAPLRQQTQEALANIKRRNFPKVLPDFTQTELKNNKRLSLPPCSSIQLVDCCSSRSARIPPAPPPRLHSTLKRKMPVGRSLDSSSPDKQFSQITVQLRKIGNDSAPDNAEKQADIIQTEGCTSARNACEEIRLDNPRKMLLVLPTIENSDSEHIPKVELVGNDENETVALL